ncbi:MAG: hypothetical protein CVV64_13465 [Candidatus Wallbacteria bacterium HGW-Wallbacteria-1]|jgi:hypothetical protein|uniref:Uncharacterized protein n=1 Tax=Candidatus Wallbacteria bacterium HGW-Wallbacteria-1 TaxID=2013854 RepID=A0A2N1PMR7_9BACT|nr:MAG: hypothetical protein CVV64_13465 [Candidatus Wallbacteria bacterium HGW-Wallbacteria-1]
MNSNLSIGLKSLAISTIVALLILAATSFQGGTWWESEIFIALDTIRAKEAGIETQAGKALDSLAASLPADITVALSRSENTLAFTRITFTHERVVSLKFRHSEPVNADRIMKELALPVRNAIVGNLTENLKAEASLEPELSRLRDAVSEGKIYFDYIAATSLLKNCVPLPNQPVSMAAQEWSRTLSTAYHQKVVAESRITESEKLLKQKILKSDRAAAALTKVQDVISQPSITISVSTFTKRFVKGLPLFLFCALAIAAFSLIIAVRV